MKMYIGEKELRLVGKAWEVRHALRKLAREAGAGAPLRSDAAASVKAPR
ncbi:Z-ring formation inhibitor MciZ [Paenibacillus albicereus]|uniref:Z-ring formation inhibitor MciZ n=1 Tax=Paenibacillus albicereus TaxID=2726185 RepID=A0A6H2GWK1_9BACL|nr:Z-ring formation inhibitor MciZ [Paenibacillus albicereus]QJC51803.1 Z-ring formation inhibitor MciZ [Paenibacillus albicereus]